MARRRNARVAVAYIRVSTDEQCLGPEAQRASIEAWAGRVGVNLMSSRNRHQVIETAIATVGEQLRAPGVADLLKELPPGEPHKVARPAGDPSTWPRVLPDLDDEEVA